MWDATAPPGMAEAELAHRRLQPLGHLSGARRQGFLGGLVRLRREGGHRNGYRPRQDGSRTAIAGAPAVEYERSHWQAVDRLSRLPWTGVSCRLALAQYARLAWVISPIRHLLRDLSGCGRAASLLRPIAAKSNPIVRAQRAR